MGIACFLMFSICFVNPAWRGVVIVVVVVVVEILVAFVLGYSVFGVLGF